MPKSLLITLCAAALIVLAAAATLGVLSAYSGQQSGQDRAHVHRCAKLTPAAARNVSDPRYGARLGRLARCAPR